MVIALLLSATIAATALDKEFCPLAPSPMRYEDNLPVRVVKGQMTDKALGAQIAARLVSTRRGSERTIGWVYIR